MPPDAGNEESRRKRGIMKRSRKGLEMSKQEVVLI
jgi:hypothetical protein